MPSSHSLVNTAPRRSWPLAEKRRIVELTLQPGASVQSVAKKYLLDPPTLSSWRTLYRKGFLGIITDAQKSKNCMQEFLPVTISTMPEIKKSGQVIVTIQMPKEIILKIEAENFDFIGVASFIVQMTQSL